MKTKQCSKCRKFSPVEKFGNDKSRKDGLFTWCKNCVSQSGKKYRSKNKKWLSQRHKEDRLKIKMEVLGHYAGGPLKCACCSELHIEFLGIDHINGKGMRHRKNIGGGGAVLYRWLRKNNYPKGYRVLCNNCNGALGLFGYCPHKSNKKGGKKCLEKATEFTAF